MLGPMKSRIAVATESAGKAQNVDMHHLSGSQRRFEILAAVIAQAEVQSFSGRGLSRS